MTCRFLSSLLLPACLFIMSACALSCVNRFEMKGPGAPVRLESAYYPASVDINNRFLVFSVPKGENDSTGPSLSFYVNDMTPAGSVIRADKLVFGILRSSDDRNYTDSYSGGMILKKKTGHKVVIHFDDVRFSILQGNYVLNGDLVARRRNNGF